MKKTNINLEGNNDKTIKVENHYYKCIICLKPITKNSYLFGNGCCSQYCNYVYSGVPMPYDYSLSLQILIEKIPKKF